MMTDQLLSKIKQSLSSGTIDWQFLVKLYQSINLVNHQKTTDSTNLIERLVLRILNTKPTLNLNFFVFENSFFNLDEINQIASKKIKTSIIQLEEKQIEITKYNPGILNLQNFTNIIDEILIKSKLPKIDIFNSKIFTFGSCFAINFARVLDTLGYKVYSNVIAEDVNSPINNFYMLEYIFLQKKFQIISEIDLNEDTRLEIKNNISSASDIIFTLGTTLYLEDKITLETTIKSKNSNNSSFLNYSDAIFYLKEIIKLIRNHNRDANIIISVSPVPIKGVKGNNECPYQFDTLSKSILRACVSEILDFENNIFYLPTYEIFRSLPMHSDFAMFGTDDGNSRHIRGDVLEKVINKILFYM
jgi:hypothetical protein